MKLLIFNHFFEQDIKAIVAASSSHEIRIIGYEALRQVAANVLPNEVFSRIEAYLEPQYAEDWNKFVLLAKELFNNVYQEYQFDALISPSDAFFYLRPWVDEAKAKSIPFIVMQKETTVSPYTMTEHAKKIAASCPFISDLMLVCSERHKQFWINTGADADKIVVTGQPRFDYYRQPERWLPLREFKNSENQGLPVLLFFSYNLDAYSPEGVSQPIWQPLRNATEAILIKLALMGKYNVIIKPHPQQRDVAMCTSYLSQVAGTAWNKTLHLAPGGFDTRHLIVNSDVVIGFQTTALFEAMAANKMVIYTAWGDEVHRNRDALIPFHEMQDALEVVTSPEGLWQLLLHSIVPLQPSADRLKNFESYLGPLDGLATKRGLYLVEQYCKNMKQVSPAITSEERSWIELIAVALGGIDGKRILEIGTDSRARKLQCISSIYQPKELIGLNPAFPSRRLSSSVRVEQIYAENSGLKDASVDGVFSDCAFEHISDLPAVLEEMHRVLIPGGLLFSHFGPIWSTSYGHHFWATDDSGNLYNYHNVLLPPWCHLLMSREEVENILNNHFPAAVASRWANNIFYSNEQNQLFFDDYERIIKASPFETILFKGYDAPNLKAKYPSAYTPKTLLELQKKFPERSGFLYDGITLLLQKKNY